MTEFHNIWIEQCEAAKNIKDEFSTQKALDYLVGEKLLNFLDGTRRLAVSNPEPEPACGRTRFRKRTMVC